jgi:lipoprotein NlpI
MARRVLLLSLLSIIVLTFALPAPAEETCDPWAARLVSLQGSVEVLRGDAAEWVTAVPGATFCSGDQIRVGANSRAALYLFNEATIRLGPHSTLRLDQVQAPRSLLVEMARGVAHFFSRFPQSLQLSTPFVNGVVKGTEFVARVDAVQTLIAVFEGRVVAANAKGEVEAASGQNLVARSGSPPLLTRMVRPRRAVHWALYYPAVLNLRPLEKTRPALQPAVEAFRRGDSAAALSALPADGGADLLLLRAALNLSVGRVVAARGDLDAALARDPRDSAAHALLAVMAVVQNDTDQALSLADKAVASKDSAAARLARSYAHQANADLVAALADAAAAVDLEADHPLAWARLAELRLALGDLHAAERAAATAVRLDDALAHTQTILGFAHLTRFETKAAAAAFAKAAELDPTAPLPRLGLGLARINEGALAEGRELLEIAVSLDPNNSLLRSYLGKAFYEEKRDPLAFNQYEMAKRLDPNDPTPWLYGAIQKQTTNRPVAALDDLQESLKRNDNRAVTRSRLLLDEDLAVRGADLARIYSDLGYEQRALYEGWAAVNADPGEAAGHRFLADAYRSLPNHEIARASELLQAQMLAPLNTSPLQPAASETDLQLLAGTTAGSAALNEYTPLFVRDRVGVQGSVLAGENNTYVNEAVVTAQGGPGVVSAGFLHYETDGFRENQDQTRDIQNVFGQVRVDPALSVQAEFRHLEAEYGDLSQNFDPEAFNLQRTEDRDHRLRLGLHYAPATMADTLVSLTITNNNQRVESESPFGLVTFDGKRAYYLAEAQQQWRRENLSLIMGGGYSSLDDDLDQFIPQPPPFGNVAESIHENVYHTNGYIYAHLNLPQPLFWTFGLALESSHGVRRDRERLNPKAGMIWQLSEDTTLRTAVMRKLSRELRNDQTLEPTQVAGFNQIFEDREGFEMLRYGAALDHRFSKRFYGGVEWSRREIDTIYTIVVTDETETDQAYEDLARAYFYWAPVDWLAARATYRYETFEYSLDFPLDSDTKELRTHYLPVGIKLFCPKGAVVGLTFTHIDQKGEFVSFDPGSPEPVVTEDEDHFWVTDLSIGFRLPKRYGLLNLEVRNLFNASFHYRDVDDAMVEYFPERTILGKLTFSF